MKYCVHCGTALDNSTNFCSNCGNKISSENNQTSNVSNNSLNQSPNNKSKFSKWLIIVGCVIIGFIVLFILIFYLVSNSSNKLVCKSKQGNITIMYNDKNITGYTSYNINYDMDEQKKIAEQIGIDEYILQFNTWFNTNTTGTCTIEKK
jgi:uncharacterized membrane protein YvbJ